MMTAWYGTRRVALTLLAGLAMAVATAGTAEAAPPTLSVSPGTVAAGGSVQVSGTCDPSTSGFAISTAFLHDSSHDFAGVGAASFSTDAAGAFSATAQIPASTTPGTYTVSGRCGGGNLGITATLVVTAAGVPTAVPAGSGGQAAATSPDTHQREILLAGVGLLLAAGGAAGVYRQRRPVRR